MSPCLQLALHIFFSNKVCHLHLTFPVLAKSIFVFCPSRCIRCCLVSTGCASCQANTHLDINLRFISLQEVIGCTYCVFFSTDSSFKVFTAAELHLSMNSTIAHFKNAFKFIYFHFNCGEKNMFSFHKSLYCRSSTC